VTDYALNSLLLVSAATMGFLVPRATTCAVAAVGEVVDERRFWRFGGFGLAALTGIVVLLPLAWLQVLPIQFAPRIELSGLIVLGAMVFGFGAAINGACIFGTLTKIVSGSTSYLFVLPGLWLGSIALELTRLPLSPHVTMADHNSALSLQSGLIWCVAIVVIISAFAVFNRNGRMRDALMMSGIGLAGGLLYTLHPHWNYTVIVRDLAQDTIMVPRGMTDTLLPWLVGAAGLGGLVSTKLAGTFKATLPNLRTSAGALVGGFAMAFGLVMIPRGNDSLVLFLIPSLVPAGAIAYVSMNIGILLMRLADRARARHVGRGAQQC
jgi:uncharacterized protein